MGEAQNRPVCFAHVKKGAKGGPPKGKSASPPIVAATSEITRSDHRSIGASCPS